MIARLFQIYLWNGNNYLGMEINMYDDNKVVRKKNISIYFVKSFSAVL